MGGGVVEDKGAAHDDPWMNLLPQIKNIPATSLVYNFSNFSMLFMDQKTKKDQNKNLVIMGCTVYCFNSKKSAWKMKVYCLNWKP